MKDQSPPALVSALNNPNGWWRDTAQRLLVETRDPATVPLLEALIRDEKSTPPGRLQALWTLHGMGKLTAPVVGTVLTASDAVLRAAAVRLSEPFFGTTPSLLARVQTSADDPEFKVRLQVALSLGQVRNAEADTTLADILRKSSDNALLRDAVISGLHDRELEFLGKILDDSAWSSPSAGRGEVLGSLANCVLREKNPVRVDRLFQLIAAQPPAAGWRKSVMLGALANASIGHEHKSGHDTIELAGPSPALDALAAENDPAIHTQVVQISNALTWPGKARPDTRETPAVQLTAPQRVLFESGKRVFEQTCAACHQTSGLGQEGLAPPLVNSPWVLGSERRLIRIALHGLDGEVAVNTKTFDMDMPPMGSLSDEDLAGILTYIRHRWGNSAPAIEPTQVTAIRLETQTRTDSWTVRELLAIP